MNLYYEDVPATNDEIPKLPPLLTAKLINRGIDVEAKAISVAATGEAGVVCYSEVSDRLDMAITLAPEVKGLDAQQIQFIAMNAVGDAIGALAPPEVSVSFRFPGYILLNRGYAGNVKLTFSSSKNNENDIPDWMVVSINIRMDFDGDDHDLEYKLENTSLSEEGAGFISRTRLLESCSRHFLVWLHQWEEEGFQSIHDEWIKRVDENKKLRKNDGSEAEFIGLDEQGSGLIKSNDNVVSVSMFDVEKIFGQQKNF